MDLGASSISLAVKDLEASATFYEKLGFQKVSGNEDENWPILRNGVCVIGLFQGMIERNILTFNPGWDQTGAVNEDFTDVREIQRRLRAAGITPDQSTASETSGPASLMITDPDGNQVLIDQHR